MGVEPEEMLKEKWIAAKSRIKNTYPKDTLEYKEHHGYSDHWGGEYKDDLGRVVRPDEQRQAKPCHARGAQPVDGDDEVEPSQYGREAGNENSHGCGDYISVEEVCTERRGESPSRIHPAGEHHIQL